MVSVLKAVEVQHQISMLQVSSGHEAEVILYPLQAAAELSQEHSTTII